MSVEQIEHELSRLRMNEDGSLSPRASVLNLIVVTDDESADDVTESVAKLARKYPLRTIVLISDFESERDLDVQVSAFCNVRGGGGSQVCAEQITIHCGRSTAEHLESLAGPLLISDLPVFLWYPSEFSSHSPEFIGVGELADRLIVDSAKVGNVEASLHQLAEVFDREGMPPVGDIQWVTLSPWRTLISGMFNSHERVQELDRICRVEVIYSSLGEVRALLLVGWLSSTLGWELDDAGRTGSGWEMGFSGPSGRVVVQMAANSPDARLRRMQLHSEKFSFQVSRNMNLSNASATIMRGDELVAKRTVHLGAFQLSPFNLNALLGEELQYRGGDDVYEVALRRAVEIIDR